MAGETKKRRLRGPRALCAEQKGIPRSWDLYSKGRAKELRLKMSRSCIVNGLDNWAGVYTLLCEQLISIEGLHAKSNMYLICV